MPGWQSKAQFYEQIQKEQFQTIQGAREMSKGSSPRPYSVDLKTFDKNWDAIFKKPDPRVIEDAKLEDEAFNELEKNNKQDKETK